MARAPISKTKLIIFSITALLITCFCLEFSARLVLSFKRNSFEYIFYGFKEIQQKQRLQKIEGKAGEEAYYKSTPSDDAINPVNSLGFRGPEIYSKKSGTIRIVCLGSSTTYGDGLDYRDTYPAILQHILDERAGKGKYEVINSGQPGLHLTQIASLVKYEILPLKPDLVILMNINNNLNVPGVWFVDIKGSASKERPPAVSPLIKLKHFAVQNSAAACLIQGFFYDGLVRYFVKFDWDSYSRKLMAPDNIWQKEFESNLEKILKLLMAYNPDINIVLLGEAVNTVRFPAMGAPFCRAKEIMSAAAEKHKNIFMVDLQAAIINAAKDGKNVWQTPAYDPLHLTRDGNEIIADLLAAQLSSMFLQPDKNKLTLEGPRGTGDITLRKSARFVQYPGI